MPAGRWTGVRADRCSSGPGEHANSTAQPVPGLRALRDLSECRPEREQSAKVLSDLLTASMRPRPGQGPPRSLRRTSSDGLEVPSIGNCRSDPPVTHGPLGHPPSQSVPGGTTAQTAAFAPGNPMVSGASREVSPTAMRKLSECCRHVDRGLQRCLGRMLHNKSQQPGESSCGHTVWCCRWRCSS
jgi:hypothetical protein